LHVDGTILMTFCFSKGNLTFWQVMDNLPLVIRDNHSDVWMIVIMPEEMRTVSCWEGTSHNVEDATNDACLKWFYDVNNACYSGKTTGGDIFRFRTIFTSITDMLVIWRQFKGVVSLLTGKSTICKNGEKNSMNKNSPSRHWSVFFFMHAVF